MWQPDKLPVFLTYLLYMYMYMTGEKRIPLQGITCGVIKFKWILKLNEIEKQGKQDFL